MDNKIDAVSAINSISKIQPISFFHGNTTKENFYDKLSKETHKKNKLRNSSNDNYENIVKSLDYLLYK